MFRLLRVFKVKFSKKIITLIWAFDDRAASKLLGGGWWLVSQISQKLHFCLHFGGRTVTSSHRQHMWRWSQGRCMSGLNETRATAEIKQQSALLRVLVVWWVSRAGLNVVQQVLVVGGGGNQSICLIL